MAEKPDPDYVILGSFREECDTRIEEAAKTVYEYSNNLEEKVEAKKNFFAALDNLITNTRYYSFDEENESSTILAELSERCQTEIDEISGIMNGLNTIQKLSSSSSSEEYVSVTSWKKRFSYEGLMINDALTPMWVGFVNEMAPPLCGAVPGTPEYIKEYLKAGHLVVVNVNAMIEQKELKSSENWILAQVVKIKENKYIISIIDKVKRPLYEVDIEEIIPLPLCKANPVNNPEAIFPKGSIVLAPEEFSSYFYPALVVDTPKPTNGTYSLRLRTGTDITEFGPLVQIPQLYVVQHKQFLLHKKNILKVPKNIMIK